VGPGVGPADADEVKPPGIRAQRRAIEGRPRTRTAHRGPGRARSRTTTAHRPSPANHDGTSTSRLCPIANNDGTSTVAREPRRHIDVPADSASAVLRDQRHAAASHRFSVRDHRPRCPETPVLDVLRLDTIVHPNIRAGHGPDRNACRPRSRECPILGAPSAVTDRAPVAILRRRSRCPGRAGVRFDLASRRRPVRPGFD